MTKREFLQEEYKNDNEGSPELLKNKNDGEVDQIMSHDNTGNLTKELNDLKVKNLVLSKQVSFLQGFKSLYCPKCSESPAGDSVQIQHCLHVQNTDRQYESGKELQEIPNDYNPCEKSDTLSPQEIRKKLASLKFLDLGPINPQLEYTYRRIENETAKNVAHKSVPIETISLMRTSSTGTLQKKVEYDVDDQSSVQSWCEGSSEPGEIYLTPKKVPNIHTKDTPSKTSFSSVNITSPSLGGSPTKFPDIFPLNIGAIVVHSPKQWNALKKYFHPKAYRPIQKVLGMKYCTELQLNDCMLDDEAIGVLLPILQLRTHLVKMSLMNNKITNYGAYSIAEFLRHHKRISSLNLTSNQITDDGAMELADSLKYHPNIYEVNLTDNNIGNEGVSALMSAKKMNPNLKHLYLKCNKDSTGYHEQSSFRRSTKSL